MSENPADAVVIERTFDAPIELMWQMWTDPVHFAAWYGPSGAAIPRAEMDVRVGGRRFICMEMQTPDGPMQMFFAGEYTVVEPQTRLVYTELMADEQGNPLTAEQTGMPEAHMSPTEIVVELASSGSGTVVTMTHVGVPEDSPGAAGWNMALDKLADHVAQK